MNDKNFLVKLGHKIRILRDSKNYSQDYLAERADLDRGYLSDIELGKTNVSVLYLKHIADALEVKIEKLFDFTI